MAENGHFSRATRVSDGTLTNSRRARRPGLALLDEVAQEQRANRGRGAITPVGLRIGEVMQCQPAEHGDDRVG